MTAHKPLAALIAVMLAGAAQSDRDETIRVPSMTERKLLRKVEPVYPDLAYRVRIQGTVRLAAVIGKDGHVEELFLISGHPMLVNAAFDAVKQWVYRPTLLDGKPVRVVTHINVPFRLDNNRKPVHTKQNDSEIL